MTTKKRDVAIGYVPVGPDDAQWYAGSSWLSSLECDGRLVGCVYPAPAVEVARRLGGVVWVAEFFSPLRVRDPEHGEILCSSEMIWIAPLDEIDGGAV